MTLMECLACGAKVALGRPGCTHGICAVCFARMNDEGEAREAEEAAARAEREDEAHYGMLRRGGY